MNVERRAHSSEPDTGVGKVSAPEKKVHRRESQELIVNPRRRRAPHRIGQTRPVMVYRMVAQDTVEEGILGLQERKRSLASAALEDTDRAAAITREELLDLLA